MDITKARKLLGNDSSKYSDEEIIRMIDFFEKMAKLFIEDAFRKDA